MSKKMMKRSLALGALMAFVITGSAFAADGYSQYTGTGTESHVSNVYWDGNGQALNLSKDKNDVAIGKQNGSMGLKNFSEIIFSGMYNNSGFLANPGVIELKDIGDIKQADGSYVDIGFNAQSAGTKLIVQAENIYMNNVWNAIYGQGGSHTEISASGNIEFSNADVGPYELVASCNLSKDNVDKQNNVLLSAKNIKLDSPTGIALSVRSYVWTPGDPPYEGTVGKNLLKVKADDAITINANIGARVKDALNLGDAVIEIDASTAEIKAKEYGVHALNKGKVVINSGETTITTTNETGYARGMRFEGASAGNVNGDLTITTTGVDFATGVDVRGASEVTLGNVDKSNNITVTTKTIAVTDTNRNPKAVTGIQVYQNQSKATINANVLNVNVSTAGQDFAYGINANTTKDNGTEHSELTVNANKTTINVSSGMEGNNAAMVAMSGGKLVVNGELEAKGDNVLFVRGGATVKINETAKDTVNLTGDICFAEPGAVIDADVLVNLSDEKSTFKGSIYSSNADRTNEIKGMTLGISNGATWDVTGDSFVNNFTLSDGNIKHNVGDVTVNKISGSGNVAFAEDSGHLHIDAGTASLNLTMKGKTADNYNDAAGLTKVAQKLGVSKEVAETDDISAKVVMAEGDVKGETTGVVTFVAPAEDSAEGNARSAPTKGDVNNNTDNYWHGEVTEVTEKVNTKNQAIGDAGISLKLHWRAHVNDMNKRMGELRNAEGEHGVWARMVRGESEYKNTKAQYNQYQLGYDEKLSVDERWTVGAAVTFAEGDANYGQGSTDDKSTAFAIYGSKLNNDGTFIDLIARYAHLESDLDDVNSGKGDYATNGMSVSAEFGKRIQQGNGLWVEPQVELTYGTIDSAEFKFDSGKAVQVGDMDSLIGRVGFRIGKDLKQGNVYARASYLYDFEGETENAFSNGTDSRTIAEDLGGGWWEVGVGANVNLSKAIYVYADVEKTFGGEVDTNWQWNLGVRYSF